MTLRDLTQNDIPEVKKLIYATWEWPKQIKTESTLDAALGLYAGQVLNQSTTAKAAVVDGKVMGVIFCAVEGQLPVCRMLQDDGSENILALLHASESERADIAGAIATLGGTYAALLEGREYDATVTFLAVNPEAQGLKLGKKLWDFAMDYFKAHNAKNMYLFTDTSCNYGFYEHLGLSRRNELPMEFHLGGQEVKLTSFLYDFTIKT